ncbi:hypothetical protein PIIN_05228 [Serendipita indica DSM 11827]|uniref:DUF202 domain-containing protein n=1 Tax=Serendipita indica (strain DSM 11827) TaxID=1109443 RepID=G4TIY2_SERID|nr:hypothetical protein PIIN_05228 [Serendipita indica DSM 11827]
MDRAEMVELRARMRTFDQVYIRTAVMNLGYSIVILKLFDRRFYRIGLLYAVLGALLYFSALARRRHSNHDFADPPTQDEVHSIGVAQGSHRVFGRPFRTAGNIVLVVSVLVASMQITLCVLLFHV